MPSKPDQEEQSGEQHGPLLHGQKFGLLGERQSKCSQRRGHRGKHYSGDMLHHKGDGICTRCYDRLSLLLEQDKMKKLKAAQILRSLAQKSDFSLAAVEVVSRWPASLLRSHLTFVHTMLTRHASQARNINALSEFVREHQRDYVQLGEPCCCAAAHVECPCKCMRSLHV